MFSQSLMLETSGPVLTLPFPSSPKFNHFTNSAVSLLIFLYAFLSICTATTLVRALYQLTQRSLRLMADLPSCSLFPFSSSSPTLVAFPPLTTFNDSSLIFSSVYQGPLQTVQSNFLVSSSTNPSHSTQQ